MAQPHRFPIKVDAPLGIRCVASAGVNLNAATISSVAVRRVIFFSAAMASNGRNNWSKVGILGKVGDLLIEL
jgi:hypothetical protein